MKLVEIDTVRRPDPELTFRVLETKRVAARTIGEALDAIARDPREGAEFHVRVVGDVHVAARPEG